MTLRTDAVRALRAIWHLRLHRKYRAFTMAPARPFWRNLLIADRIRHVSGCVIECGVWRGGMSAALAEVLGPSRQYFLFDSFQGLPPAGVEDGATAMRWQADTQAPTYFDNCSAQRGFAERAMTMAGVPKFTTVEGWFADTLPNFTPPTQIALLRLDGDWYESTMTALRALFPHVASDGLTIIDDYYAWDGCSRAVHDYLSQNQTTARITQKHGICVIEKR